MYVNSIESRLITYVYSIESRLIIYVYNIEGILIMRVKYDGHIRIHLEGVEDFLMSEVPLSRFLFIYYEQGTPAADF